MDTVIYIKRYVSFFLTLLTLLAFCLTQAQQKSLDFFLDKAKENAVSLKENENLLKIGAIQNALIIAQNQDFKIDATSEVLFAPFFNSNGRAIDITTNPSNNAYGYDAGITNGGLYSAQINITKNLFNGAATDNLLFQNKLKNEAITLSSKDIFHNLEKNIIDNYILVYQYQLQETFTNELKTDLEKRLQVVELLVKRGLLSESDYLLIQSNIDSKNLELQQIRSSINQAKTQLYNLCGIPLENHNTLEAPLLKLNDKQDTFFFEKTFKNDSLQILADKNVFENQYKPQVSVYGNTGLNAIDAKNIPHNFGVSAGIKLKIPIYDGNQKKYNALQNDLKQETLEFYKENKEIQLQNNLKSLLQQIDDLQKNRQLIESQIAQQQNLLEIFKGKLAQGQTSIIDYLNVIQNYKLTVYTKLQMQTNLWLLYNQYNFINW
ncbi:hypothetical protein GCM10007962_18800 [Yeosuana aromativorans]|uniref:TolC family protein n=1 Tax=Yeosuana aromativorans TaxID=288019 RepID=A0A8J3BJW3_9FLAO|nr:TolC family protein [Yeosuana aromativorans]GGK24793.1 hypothetical protein GCM10007962_18800 [Yeosuana aromativorans]